VSARYHNNQHHLFYIRRSWSSKKSKQLRSYHYCIVSIPVALHDRIHAEVQEVPVPRASSIDSAIDQLDYLSRYGAIKPTDNIEKRLGVLVALFECVEPETAKALRQQLRIVREFYRAPR
jgi:hypothetical protein